MCDGGCALNDPEWGRDFCGWGTVYVERVWEERVVDGETKMVEKTEERWDKERVEKAREWVEVWVGRDEGGLVGVAERMRGAGRLA